MADVLADDSHLRYTLTCGNIALRSYGDLQPRGKFLQLLKDRSKLHLYTLGRLYKRIEMIVDDIFKPDNIAGSAITKNMI